MQVLTAEQARIFLNAARENRYEALFVLAVTTGMRQDELLALRWRDVDLEGGHVQIRATIDDGERSARGHQYENGAQSPQAGAQPPGMRGFARGAGHTSRRNAYGSARRGTTAILSS
jgi:integrase